MDKNVQFLLGIVDLVVILIVIAIGIFAPLFRIKAFGKAAVLASLGFVFLGLGAVIDLGYHAWAAFGYAGGDAELFEKIYWTRTILRGLSVVIGLIMVVIAFVLKPRAVSVPADQ